jgi:hypothetical protein
MAGKADTSELAADSENSHSLVNAAVLQPAELQLEIYESKIPHMEERVSRLAGCGIAAQLQSSAEVGAPFGKWLMRSTGDWPPTLAS